jgi:parallel beta-helix repeat protein
VTATGTTGKFTVAISNFTSVLTVGTSTLVGGSVATTTIDTAGIHDARNAAGVGGTVFFPPGTYLVSGLTANVVGQTWELAPGATVKMATGAANCLLITADDVTIDGGLFDASNGTAHDFSQNGIRVESVDGVTIRNAEISDSPFIGIWNIQGSQFTVTGCRIINSYGGGIFVLNGTDATVVSDILITGNHVESSGLIANGIGVLGGGEGFSNRPVQRVKISHNTVILPTNSTQPTSTLSCIQCRDWIISDNISQGSELGISNGTITRGTISNNVISKFKGLGIEIGASINGCTVSGNIIDGTGTTDALGILGASGTTDTVSRLNISGNTIFGFTGIMTAIGLVRVSGTTSQLKSATISDNIIQADCSSFKGISLGLPVSDVTISGNTFDAATITTLINGIEFQKSATNCTIVGNTFKSETSGLNRPIVFGSSADTVSGLVVAGNMFKAGVSAGYSPIETYSALNNATFTGNSVNGETSTFSSAINLYGAVNGLTVSGNQFSNLSAAVVRLLANTAVTLQNITVGSNNLVSVANKIQDDTSGGATVASSVITTDNDSTATLTNKSIALGSNTITGTLAQFNTAVTDANLARIDAAQTFTGVQTMTSPSITTPTGIVQGDVGLGNVDNTSDANKPISTATQTALNTVSHYGWPGGVAGETIVFGGNTGNIASQAEGRLIFTAYWVPKTTPISRIAVYVGLAGSAGSVVRIGAYADDNGIPGALIFDAGTVSSATTGDKEITTSQTLPAGRFWLAAVVQGGADTLARLAGVNATNAWNTNAILMNQGDGYGLDAVYFTKYKGSVSGALPDPAFSSRALSGGGENNVGYTFRVKLA